MTSRYTALIKKLSLEVEVIVGYLTVTRKSNMDSTPPRGALTTCPIHKYYLLNKSILFFTFLF